jgi:Ras-related protein Rab-2A
MPITTDPPQLPWHYISKLVCIGDSGTGKSSLTIRLCEGRFVNSHDVTIGVEFGSRIVPVGPPANAALHINDSIPSGLTVDATSPSATSPSGHSNGNKAVKEQKKMKLSLWDTAGQETYKSITRSYFRGASGALLVFDLSRRSTFESVTAWLQDLRQIAEDDIVVILVGNKSDLADQTTDVEGKSKRAVTKDEAEAWCRREGVLRYVETSAKSGEGVERAFLEVAERVYQNIEAGKYDLNDRRSGVKGYGAGGGREGGTAPKTVTLGLNDAMKGSPSRFDGGCC